MSQPRLSVVIPAYNEEEGLEKLLLEELYPVLQTIFEDEVCWEVLVVDDGSADQTFEVVRRLSGEHSWLYGLRLSRNFGKEGAMLAGLEASQGEVVLTMDADGQHPPALLPQMWEMLHDESYDVISGVKEDRRVDTLAYRMSASLFYKGMFQLSGLRLEGASDFKLMRRRVVEKLLAQPERLRFFRGLVPWLGFRQGEVCFTVRPRLAGKTSWSFAALVRLALTAITSFTAAPLSWVLYLGGAGLVVSFLMIIHALTSRFMGVAISGWTSLTILLLFFGSTTLVGLGLIGIYIARIYEEVKGRDPFIICEIATPSAPNGDTEENPEDASLEKTEHSSEG